MKQSSKNESDVLDLINKLQEQLIALDKKVDILIQRSLTENKPIPKPPLNNASMPVKPNDHHRERERHKAICADCQKECTIPFKPSGDRPVYCQDCFSRRKVISLSGIKLNNSPKETPPVQTAIKKTVDIKKPQAKKKVAIKKSDSKKKVVPKKK